MRGTTVVDGHGTMRVLHVQCQTERTGFVEEHLRDAAKGVSGEVNGHAVRVGRLSFAAAGEEGFLAVDRTAPSRSEDDLRTRFGLLQPDEMASYVSVDGQLIARIVLLDVPRANAKAVLAKLHELGVT